MLNRRRNFLSCSERLPVIGWNRCWVAWGCAEKIYFVCRALFIFVRLMISSPRNTLIRNFSSLSLMQVTGFLLSLIVIPHVLRRVGVDGFGVIAVAQVVIFYLSALTDYGFNRTATREIALFKNDREKISRVFSVVLITKILICIVSFIVLLVLLWLVPLFQKHMALYLLAFSFVIGQVVMVNWFYQGMEKMQFMAITSLLARLIFVVLVFVFIRDKEDNRFFIFFLGVGNMIAGLLSLYAAVRMYRLTFIRPGWHSILHEIKNGWQVTLTNLSQTTCQYIGIFILRLFTNDTLVGYYSVAEKIYFAMKLMLDAVGQVLYPGVCIVEPEGKEKILKYYRKTFTPFLIMVVSGTAAVFVFAPPILHFFIGHSFDYSVFLLRMFCIAVVIVCFNIPPQLVLFAGNHKKSFLIIFFLGTILNLLANLVLARYFDATGTVVSVLITEVFITVALYREMYRIYFLKPEVGRKEITSMNSG